MAVTYYLGVDRGTTMTKAVVSDNAGHAASLADDGRIATTAYLPHRETTRNGFPPARKHPLP